MEEEQVYIDPSEISTLTDTQEKIISIIPVFPSLLSVSCSSIIIYLVYKKKFDTPYRRILFGLSVSDIISSIAFALQPFLLPSDTSQRVWAIGNDTTCSVLGTITQISMSNLLYNGMLSFYYLLTIRFGYKEWQFVNKFERYMHIFCIGYPTICAFTGLGLGVYHELELGPGCWVSDWPEGCTDDTGECKSPLVAWVFSGIWVLLTLLAIVINNIIIYRYVRRQMHVGARRSMDSTAQTNRIRAVAVQAFLYVAAYLGTYIWTVILRVMESRSYDAEDEATLYPLLILQGIAVPSTGFFNLCIYIRPRYLNVRKDYPLESKYWAIRRALYGEAIIERGTSSTRTNSNADHSTVTIGSGIFLSREKMSCIMKILRLSKIDLNITDIEDDLAADDKQLNNCAEQQHHDHQQHHQEMAPTIMTGKNDNDRVIKQEQHPEMATITTTTTTTTTTIEDQAKKDDDDDDNKNDDYYDNNNIEEDCCYCNFDDNNNNNNALSSDDYTTKDDKDSSTSSSEGQRIII